MERRSNRLERFNTGLSHWFEYAAIAGVLGMIVATSIDIAGSKLFNWPLPVGTEAIYLCQIVAMAGALAIAKIDGRHVRIEMIDRLPQPALGIVHAIVALVGLALFVALTWTSFDYAFTLRANNEITTTSKIPLYPFAIWMGLCSIPMVLILVEELIRSVLEIRKA